MASLIYASHPTDYKLKPGDGINHIKTLKIEIVKYVMSWKMNSILF